MIDTEPKQIERLKVLIALYNQVKGDINVYTDLEPVAEQNLQINKTRLSPIFKYFQDNNLIRPMGRGFTCYITNAGVDLVQSQSKRSDKELIMEFLDFIDEDKLYYVEGYFHMIGIKSTMKINHLYKIMVGNDLVDVCPDPTNVMANYKGKMLTNDGYDELFKKEVGAIPIGITNNITINGHGNIANTGNNSTITANITITKGDKAALENALQQIGVELKDIKDLMNVIDQELPTEDGSFGAKVNHWLVKLLSKSIEIGEKVGISAVGALAAAAIKGYYGLH